MGNREYTTDITELSFKNFCTFQRALLTLTMGEGWSSMEEIIIKTMHLINKGRKVDAIQELNSVLTVINNIETSESSIYDGLKALLKNGDLDKASYKEMLQEFEEVKKKSLTNN
jgi:septation ring formation regulator EzrA